jgi:hypothetical protein
MVLTIEQRDVAIDFEMNQLPAPHDQFAELDAHHFAAEDRLAEPTATARLLHPPSSAT